MLTEKMCYYRLLIIFILYDWEGGITNTNDDLQRKGWTLPFIMTLQWHFKSITKNRMGRFELLSFLILRTIKCKEISFEETV